MLLKDTWWALMLYMHTHTLYSLHVHWIYTITYTYYIHTRTHPHCYQLSPKWRPPIAVPARARAMYVHSLGRHN
uniref:Uncharacterized protein n=1 Tax=Arundo donax TaxID=35708 RepID=A0A0A9D3X0_ARUDO